MAYCLQMQAAMKKGDALQHPLKANVTYNNSAIFVTNQESVEWDSCYLEVNGITTSTDKFSSNDFAVSAGKTVTISWSDIANDEGQRFNYFQTKPYLIDLDCSVNNQE